MMIFAVGTDSGAHINPALRCAGGYGSFPTQAGIAVYRGADGRRGAAERAASHCVSAPVALRLPTAPTSPTIPVGTPLAWKP